MAGKEIKRGNLVIFPTETVYGLGANALDKKAVKKIFRTKGRPSDNPLIVHIAHKSDIKKFTKDIPKEADLLIKKFWPGPLSLILNKRKAIPSIVTGGHDTLAIRMPAHTVALALIRATGVPIAAPSANISGRPSGTQIKDIAHEFKNIDGIILDAGSSSIGLESTVLDLTVRPFVILRPGAITKEMIERCIGQKVLYAHKKSPAKSPGMKYRHYSPKAKVILVIGNVKDLRNNIYDLRTEYEKLGQKACIIKFKNLKDMAKNLYSKLRECDEKGFDIAIIASVEEKGLGVAIMNRLKKAASRIVRI